METNIPKHVVLAFDKFDSLLKKHIEDPKHNQLFSHSIEFQHQDGSKFSTPYGSALKINSHWWAIYTEHCGHLVIHEEDIAILTSDGKILVLNIGE